MMLSMGRARRTRFPFTGPLEDGDRAPDAEQPGEMLSVSPDTENPPSSSPETPTKIHRHPTERLTSHRSTARDPETRKRSPGHLTQPPGTFGSAAGRTSDFAGVSEFGLLHREHLINRPGQSSA